jgi:hypothetical protein
MQDVMRFGEAVSLRPGAYAGSCAARDNELLTLCMLMPDARSFGQNRPIFVENAARRPRVTGKRVNRYA